MQIRTIDAHAEGAPLRLVVDGFPRARGQTMMDKRAWMKRHTDDLRRALMLEPRGHADMCGAVLTEPVSPGADAGVLFMDTDGFSAMSGHGVIAATTIALERGLLVTAGDGSHVTWDTPAGAVRARATRTGSRVDRVSFTSVPSFVLHGGLPVTLRGRTVRADVVFAGEFYAIVDAESVGLAIDPAHLPEIRRLAAAVRDAIQSSHAIVHPLDSRIEGIDGVIITGPAHGPGADLRNVTVFGTQVDRSPCGAGTTAVMSVIDAMALMAEDTRFVQESLIGTRLSGRVVDRTQVGDYPAIVTEIEGSAWITGEHTFLVDAADPLRNGFRL